MGVRGEGLEQDVAAPDSFAADTLLPEAANENTQKHKAVWSMLAEAVTSAALYCELPRTGFDCMAPLQLCTMFLVEHEPDVLKQDKLSQKDSKTISCRPQKMIRALFGGPIGEPGRLATA